jgi:DNA repair exonuclease SbcCD ATPase subunit
LVPQACAEPVAGARKGCMSEARILAELAALGAGQDQLAAAVESGMDWLRADNGRLPTDLAALRVSQERLELSQEKTRVDIMARVDEAVTGIRDDIKVNFGAADSVRRSNEHLREELHDWQNMVAQLQRQLISLSERVASLEMKS